MMKENEQRSELVRFANKLDEQGLNRGTSGNLSARFGDGMLITPSGMGAEGLTEDDIVFVHMDGTSRGRWQPSSEWLFHRDIYAQRPEFGAVVHTHSVAATEWVCTTAPNSGRCAYMSRWNSHSLEGCQRPREVPSMCTNTMSSSVNPSAPMPEGVISIPSPNLAERLPEVPRFNPSSSSRFVMRTISLRSSFSFIISPFQYPLPQPLSLKRE